MQHIVLYSTGLASSIVLDMVQRKYGRENTIALMTDTKWEDEDNYRYGKDVIDYLGTGLVRKCEGRTPPEVWLQSGYLVGPTGSPCTRKLKIEQTIKYVKGINDSVSLYFGIGADEAHRTYSLIKRYGQAGAKCVFPLIENPMSHQEMQHTVEDRWGIPLPRMYGLGFSHANCGGRCVKAGFGHFQHLMRVWPERFQELAEIEQAFRDKTGGDTTILRATIRGKRVKVPLKRLEEYSQLKQLKQLSTTWEQTTPCECLM